MSDTFRFQNVHPPGDADPVDDHVSTNGTSMSKKIINVKADGTIQMIYDDRLRGLLDHGKTHITRVSHVDPSEELSKHAVAWLKQHRGIELLPGDKAGVDWWADLLPSSGGVLGPFHARQEALNAEVAWINQNLLQESLWNL